MILFATDKMAAYDCADCCSSPFWFLIVNCLHLQAESDCDDLTTDQAIQAKMKNAFVSQNVSSLQELGKKLLLSVRS